MRWILWELAVLGELPTRAELVQRAGGRTWAVEVGHLWAERVREPTRTIRARRPWRYPFVVPSDLVNQHALRPLEDRLADQAVKAARAYSAAIRERPSWTELRTAEDRLRLQTHALRVWGQTLDSLRHSDEVLGKMRLRRYTRFISPLPPS